MTTLVTGATGLLGNNVVRALLARGDAVRVLARESSDPRPLADLDIEIVRGDIRDLDTARRACCDADIVVHAAGWVHLGWSGADLAWETNVEGTRCVAQAALEHGLRMIHVSSINALGLGSWQQPADEQSPPGGQVRCPYVLTKREAEEVVRQLAAEGLDVVIVNPGLMFGPWDWKPSSGRILLELTRHFVPLAPRGGCSVCDVRDVADGILAAIDKGQTNRNYLLAGHNMLYLDLFRMVAEVTGRPRPWCPRRLGPVAGWQMRRRPVAADRQGTGFQFSRDRPERPVSFLQLTTGSRRTGVPLPLGFGIDHGQLELVARVRLPSGVKGGSRDGLLI